ncbi:hypothetical protein BGZ51_008521 [Haplosporangium sp. Z 767]|nr:hypothetical protein BGZ51_008521 [Haplosporangium sp. Z 767]
MSVAIVAIAQEFNYSKPQQGLILASFFIGYILTPIIGGTLADRYGGKSVLALGALAWTVCTLLTPLASGMGLVWVVLVRIALGLGEGVAYPSIHAMIGKWIPPCERSKAVATVTAFSYLGPVIALPTSSALVVSSWGWRSIFWLFGALGLLWNVAWQIWGASDPLSCSRISEQEAHWILEQQRKDRDQEGVCTTDIGNADPIEQGSLEDSESDHTRMAFGPDGVPIVYQSLSGGHAPELHVPRSSEDSLILTHRSPNARASLDSESCESMLIEGSNAHRQQSSLLQSSDLNKSSMSMRWQKFRNQMRMKVLATQGPKRTKNAVVPWKELMARKEVWSIIISQSWLPTFYLDFYGVEVGKIGYFAVVPSIFQGIMGLTAGVLGDKAVQDWKWTPLTVRRMGQTIGSVGLGIFLLLAVKLAQTATLAMILITIGMTLNGFTMIGASAYQE